MDTPNCTTKICSQCQLEKPVYEFHKHARENDGYRKKCKQCRAQNEGFSYVKPAPPGYQWCRKCDTLYPATSEHFYWNSTQGRFYASCKACHYIRTRNWQKANLEFWYGLNKRWALRNPEKKAAGWQKWKTNHPESFAAYKIRNRITAKIWSINNPDKVRISHKKGKAKRRAREANAPGSHTAADIRLQVTAQTDKQGRIRCWWCSGIVKPDDYHVDHRIALAKGGSNSPDNLVISCPTCNMSKKDKSPQEWAGRLL